MPRLSDRLEARRKILQTANRYIASGNGRHGWTFRVFDKNGSGRGYPAYLPGRLIGMRHLQQAVCVCRRNGLVSPAVLAAAGFNPEGGRR